MATYKPILREWLHSPIIIVIGLLASILTIGSISWALLASAVPSLNSGTDAYVSLEQVSETSEDARFESRYRVASADEELGPVRLFRDIVDTDGNPFDNIAEDSLRVYLMAGAQKLDAQQIPLDALGKEPLRLDSMMGWRPASGNDRVSDNQVVLEGIEKRQGFVLGRAGPDTVAEGTFISTVSLAKEKPLKVNSYVRKAGGDEWKVQTDATPGDRLEFLIRAENVGGREIEDLIIATNLAGYLSIVPGSTTIINTNYPDGIEAGTDNVSQGGIDIGDYKPGSVAYVRFELQINPSSAFKHLGRYTLRNVGIARAQGTSEYYNVAIIDVNVEGDE